MLELYHSETSVCSCKVRLALAEKQLDFTSHVLNLMKGEQHSPEYRALNPNALVPTLVHDGLIVVESTVINEYLDDRFEQNPLRPKDAAGRARMRIWTRQPDDGVHEMVSVLSFAIAFRHILRAKSPADLSAHYAGITDLGRRARIRDAVENGPKAEQVGTAIHRFDRLLTDMERTLGQRTWLAGDELTLADVAIAPYVSRLAQLQLDFMWSQRPRVAAWYDAWRKRPAYTAALDAWFAKVPSLAAMAERGREALPVMRQLLAER